MGFANVDRIHLAEERLSAQTPGAAQHGPCQTRSTIVLSLMAQLPDVHWPGILHLNALLAKAPRRLLRQCRVKGGYKDLVPQIGQLLGHGPVAPQA
jgi:hypothetical protein